MKNITGRLIIAVISTTLEETAIFAIGYWGLPRLGINIPLAVVIVIMVAWAAYAVITFRMGTRALARQPVLSLPHMIGSTGIVVRPLAPEGIVKIKGELWTATSGDGELAKGREIMVVGQDRLKLVVRDRKATDSQEEAQ